MAEFTSKAVITEIRGFEICSPDNQERYGFVVELDNQDGKRWSAFNPLHDLWLVGRFNTANEAITAVLQYEEKVGRV